MLLDVRQLWVFPGQDLPYSCLSPYTKKGGQTRFLSRTYLAIEGCWHLVVMVPRLGLSGLLYMVFSRQSTQLGLVFLRRIPGCHSREYAGRHLLVMYTLHEVRLSHRPSHCASA